MQCDKCSSDNTQRLEVVFENGTSNINTKSHSAGAGIGGTFGIGGVTTKTTGTSQTVLGKKAAPPLKKTYKWAVISIIVGWLFLSNGGDTLVFGGALIAAGAYFIYAAATYNKNEWPALYKHWQECWLCHKCGNIYHHA
jgi:hypothetical protein